MNFGKWIGGGLGWAFGGPIGALVGFALGSLVDTANNAELEQQQGGKRRRSTAGDFELSLLVLAAAVMKADGKILRSELDYVRDFLIKNFGKEHAHDQLLVLRDLVKKDIPVNDVAKQVKLNLDYSSRLQLMHFLFGIAIADGEIDSSEWDLLERLSDGLGISSADFSSIAAMFSRGKGRSKEAYEILEISPEASADEIKKAYRKMAIKYHPDKVSHLGDDVQKAAKEKFQEVQNAYDLLKEKHNIK